jgi:osmotically-inducible protein OsmY
MVRYFLRAPVIGTPLASCLVMHANARVVAVVAGFARASAALALTTLAACRPPQSFAPQAYPWWWTTPAVLPSNAALEQSVRGLFARDPHVRGETLVVVAVGGVVSIEGSVHTLLAKERAVSDAKHVEGVRAVVDHAAIQQTFTSDPDLVQNVQRAFADEPVTRPFAIAVEAKDGIVRLRGEVDSWQALRVAREAAAGTPGVREVSASLAVHPAVARTDDRVRAEVESRLRDDIRAEPGLVRVTVREGTVDLSGQVPDVRDRAALEEDAWGTGVRAVRDSLEFLFDAGPDVPPWPGLVADADIADAALAALERDPRLIGTRPSVFVHNGLLALEGRVPNSAARDAAEADAENTVGVVEVQDDMSRNAIVRLPDAEVVDRTSAALRLDLDAERVRVTAHDGVVTLTGQVATERERKAAIRYALASPGVARVIDSLAIAPEHHEEDAKLVAGVEGSLATTYVPPFGVRASASNGVVTLEGRVGDPSEIVDAVAAAYRAGATDVRNRLYVGAPPVVTTAR